MHMLTRSISMFDRHCFRCCQLLLCRYEKFYWSINRKRAELFRITGGFMVMTKTPGFLGVEIATILQAETLR
jgi:hypothetical protein